MHPGKIPAQTNQDDAAIADISHQQGQAVEVDDIQAANKPAGNATIAAATAGTLMGLLLARRPR